MNRPSIFLGVLDDFGEVAEFLRRSLHASRRVPGPTAHPVPIATAERRGPGPSPDATHAIPFRLRRCAGSTHRSDPSDDVKIRRDEGVIERLPPTWRHPSPIFTISSWQSVGVSTRGGAREIRPPGQGAPDPSFRGLHEETRRLRGVVPGVEVPADGTLDALAVVEGGDQLQLASALAVLYSRLRPMSQVAYRLINGGRARRVRRPCASRTKAVGVDQRVGDASGHGGRAGGLGEEVEELAPG